MAIYQAPSDYSAMDKMLKSVFLAGSIEMDQAVNWQRKCEELLGDSFNVFNPRRTSWDSSWKQEMGNPQFRKQVEWELDALENADYIILFFAAGTKSPISLLEFGLFARSGKLRVVCEESFWRKGNVDIVCHKYGVLQYENLEEAILQLTTDEKNFCTYV